MRPDSERGLVYEEEESLCMRREDFCMRREDFCMRREESLCIRREEDLCDLCSQAGSLQLAGS